MFKELEMFKDIKNKKVKKKKKILLFMSYQIDYKIKIVLIQINQF